ncbi:hypothetical protein HK096_008188 [Nowakowskiella sp. JEL0078]|nr:hypothetical protein HK096_008188 [Nowakowskiella sp. JEL0078]
MSKIEVFPAATLEYDAGGITLPFPQANAEGVTPRITEDSVAHSEDVLAKLPHSLRPLKLRGVTLKNRFVVSPMCMYSAIDGFPNSFHLAHLGQFAIRGVGLIIVEATGVQSIGRISPNCVGIWKDEHIASHKAVVDLIHSQGSKAGIQLAHAGRKASSKPPMRGRENLHNLLATTEFGGWPDDVISATSNHVFPDAAIPRAATKEDINNVVNSFVEAARRADEAGYDIIEIHAAHGYLVHQFYSQISNTRKDEYGGSFENRIRILTDIIKNVRKVWPENKPIFVRLSATEWSKAELAWKIEDSIKLIRILYSLGVDLIDVSSSPVGPGDPKDVVPVDYSKPWNRALAKEIVTKIPGASIGVVGGICKAEDAEDIVKSGDAQLILAARVFLRNPNWALDAADELIEKSGHSNEISVSWPSQYARSGASFLKRK